MTKYIITGGAGFIGSNIATEIVRQNEEVKIIDNLSSGKISNIKEIKSNIKIAEGDVKNIEFLKKEFAGYDYVLHHAAKVSVKESTDHPFPTIETNDVGTLNVLQAAKESGIKRVVFASSAAVYGNTKKSSIKEEQKKEPLTAYAITKLTGEYYCKMFYSLYGLETISLRYFNVFGEKQNPETEYAAVIPKFIKLMLENKKPTIYGDGLQTRDFVNVKNVVQANLLACKIEKTRGETFNIATGKSINLLYLIYYVNKILNKNIKPFFSEAIDGDIKNSTADISKAKRVLGYTPATSFESGLKKTVEWFKHLTV